MNVVDEEDHEQWINLYQNIANRLGGIGSVQTETSETVDETGIRKDIFSFLEHIRTSERSRYDILIDLSRAYSKMNLSDKKQSISGMASQLK